MTASSRPRVRRHEEARKARGERYIKVWVPDDPRAAAKIRDLANRLCKAAQAQQHQPATNTDEEDQPS